VTTIDSDAHVIETDQTWSYMGGDDLKYQPVTMAPAEERGRPMWLIDGTLKARPDASERGSETSATSREMRDIDERLGHMDRLGVDIQVLYPTIYTRQIATTPAADTALGRSWNRWLADIWSRGKGRLRWVAVPPLLELEKAAKEMEFAREHGACGIVMRGFEGDRHLPDPYFHPLYEVAQDLDLPICVHAGNANRAVANFLGNGNDGGSLLVSKTPVMASFHDLIMAGTPEKFPKLRFGFIEASSQWVPYILHDLVRRIAHRQGNHLQGRMRNDFLRENRLYVACQTDDDLPYVLKYTGEDNLVMGSDYGHADTTAELQALSSLRETAEVDGTVVNKILDDNARALYGL